MFLIVFLHVFYMCLRVFFKLCFYVCFYVYSLRVFFFNLVSVFFKTAKHLRL